MAYTKAPDEQLLQAALVGYEHQRAIVDERIAEIRRELAGASGGSGAGEGTPRRGMSAEGRRRIAAAQRKRWAELKQGSAAPVKVKRKRSAEARKRIADATRKRWKAYRAAKAAAAK